jgi:hypothetical protein
MSYRCGISPGVAVLIGEAPDGPRIVCDGCGIVYRIREDRLPPAWFFQGKAPPKWKLVKKVDGMREDRCPTCQQPSETRLNNLPNTDKTSK